MSNDEKCTVKMSGYLEKKSKLKVMSSWKNYWFVLEGRLLLYYRSKDTLSPCKGSINLGPRCTVKPAAAGTCIFQIETRSNTIVLKAPNRLEQEKWLQAILTALNQTPTSPNGMMHFRYSSGDLMPSPPTENVKPFTFTRQYTMPERLQVNRSEIKQRLQNIGAKSYGGSLETIQKLAKVKSPQGKRRNLLQRKQSKSIQDVTFTCGDDGSYPNIARRKTYAGAESTCSSINNDQYCTVDETFEPKKLSSDETELPLSKSQSLSHTDDVFVENDQYCVVKEAEASISSGKIKKETQKAPTRTLTACSFILDNDQYITNDKIRSNINEDTEILRDKLTETENIYERVSGDSQLDTSAIIVDNETYIADSNRYRKVSQDSDFLVDNDQYSIAKELMQETETVNYHEYNIPAKQESENIYCIPQTDTDLNDNNVSSSADHQQENEDINPYSICQIYPKRSQSHPSDNTLYEVVTEVYSEPLLPPRPENSKINKTNERANTLLSRLKKFGLHGDGHDKDSKIVKKRSFIRKLFKKKDRKPVTEELEEQQYVTIDECMINKLDRNGEIDKQVLEELQKILMNKKDALIEKMKSEVTSQEEIPKTTKLNYDELSHEIAAKCLKPVLPHKQKKASDCLLFTQLKGRVKKNNGDCADESEKLKTIDEILNDLNKEKQKRDIKLGEVITSEEQNEEDCTQNVKQLIDKFNKVGKSDEIILRQKTPTNQERINEDEIKENVAVHRHSDELNRLLNELIKVTNAPILTPGVTNSLGVTRMKDDELLSMISSKPRRFSDPDYDIPRPHSNLKIERSSEKSDNMLTATRFFGPVLSSNQNNSDFLTQASITPDSLEIRTSRDDDMAFSYSSHNYTEERVNSPVAPTFQFFSTNGNLTQNSLQNANEIVRYQSEKDCTTNTTNLLERSTSDIFMDSLEPISEKSTIL